MTSTTALPLFTAAKAAIQAAEETGDILQFLTALHDAGYQIVALDQSIRQFAGMTPLALCVTGSGRAVNVPQDAA